MSLALVLHQIYIVPYSTHLQHIELGFPKYNCDLKFLSLFFSHKNSVSSAGLDMAAYLLRDLRNSCSFLA